MIRPSGGSRISRGVPPYCLTNFLQKLHENKEILAPGRVPPTPTRSATEAGMPLNKFIGSCPIICTDSKKLLTETTAVHRTTKTMRRVTF